MKLTLCNLGCLELSPLPASVSPVLEGTSTLSEFLFNISSSKEFSSYCFLLLCFCFYLFSLSYCIAFKIYHCHLVRFQRHNSVVNNVPSPLVLTKSSHAFPQSLGNFMSLPNAVFLLFPLCLAFKL